jgi:predicted RNase H-like HicB family nuclease
VTPPSAGSLPVAGAVARFHAKISDMTTVHVPYTVEQDEDGVWCAHAWLGSSGGANGNGSTREEAVASLREAVEMVIEDDGVPVQLAHSLETALT